MDSTTAALPKSVHSDGTEEDSLKKIKSETIVKGWDSISADRALSIR